MKGVAKRWNFAVGYLQVVTLACTYWHWHEEALAYVYPYWHWQELTEAIAYLYRHILYRLHLTETHADAARIQTVDPLAEGWSSPFVDPKAGCIFAVETSACSYEQNDVKLRVYGEKFGQQGCVHCGDKSQWGVLFSPQTPNFMSLSLYKLAGVRFCSKRSPKSHPLG